MRITRLAALLAVVAELAAPLAAQTGLRPTDPPRAFSLPRTMQVPIDLDPEGRPIVRVMVDGRGPFRFGIDWGANVLAVSDSVGRGLPVADQSGGPGGRPLVRVGALAIGEARFEGLTAIVGGFLDGSVDGIIGFSVLKDCLTTFDFPNRTLTLALDTLPAPNGRTILPLVASDPGRLLALRRIGPNDPQPQRWFGDRAGTEGFVTQPSIAVRIGDRVVSAVLDTRAPVWLALPDSLLDSYQVVSGPVDVGGQGPQMGVMRVRNTRIAQSLVVGDYEVARPIVSFRNRPGPVLGMGFLRHFVVSLDERTGRLSLRPGTVANLSPSEEAWERLGTPAAAMGPDAAAYAGVYGNRAVTWLEGALYMQRTDLGTDASGQIAAPRLRLVPTGTPDEFGVVEVAAALVRFMRDASGRPVELRVRQRDGTWDAGRRQ